MKIKSLKWFIALAMLFSFLSCRQLEIEEEGNPIMQIIGEMSLKEKVCQMFILRPESLVRPDDPKSLEVTQLSEEMADFFRDYPAGGFCLYAHNIITPEQLAEFTEALHSLSPSPLLCIDEEGGRVARIANNDVVCHPAG